MELCEKGKIQKTKGRHEDAHEDLVAVGAARNVRGVRTAGYEEQDYDCSVCGAQFMHSSDSYDDGWMILKRT